MMFYSPEYLAAEQKSCRLHLSFFYFFSIAALISPKKKKKNRHSTFCSKQTLKTISSPAALDCLTPADQLLEMEVAGEEEQISVFIFVFQILRPWARSGTILDPCRRAEGLFPLKAATVLPVLVPVTCAAA